MSVTKMEDRNFSHITADMVNDEIIRLAEEYPEATYIIKDESRSCLYTEGAAGPGSGCLFGQALLNLGVPKELLMEFDHQYFVDNSDIRVLSSYLNLGSTDPLWPTIQTSQDIGEPWGDAVSPLINYREGNTGNSDGAVE